MATFTVSMTLVTADDEDEDADSTLVEQSIRDLASEENWQIVSLLVIGP